MPEDGQPNDLRGRSTSATLPSIRSTRTIPNRHDYFASLASRSSFKRPPDRFYTSSAPAKRRRLDKNVRKEIIRQLPPACWKGAPGCHGERRNFVVRETESLEKSQPGLKVLSHAFADGVVYFSCTQADILNCSLAPKPGPANGIQRSQPKVESLSQSLPTSDPIISTITGPPRFFKSGTLSFKPRLPVAGETFKESFIATRTSAAFDTDLEHLTPVAELIFGKQGPPKLTKPIVETSVSTPSMTSVQPSSSISQTVKPRSQMPPAKTSKGQIGGKASLSEPIQSTRVVDAPSSQAPPSKTVDAQISSRTLSSEFTQSSSPARDLDIPSTSHDTDMSLSNRDYVYEPDGDEFRIPIRQQHDKLRRFLCGTTPSSSVIVSMYGALEGADVASQKHWLIANSPTKEAIDDACLVTEGDRSITVLGRGRDNQQLSFINTDNIVNGVVSAIDLERPWNPAKKGGVSAVAAMMEPLMFASGGYDHCVHLWRFKNDLSSASPEALNIKHNSQVQSLLAIYDTSHKLVSAGADCSVHIWDLASERVVNTVKTSNSVYHAHTTTSPFCTLLEVAHRELQFEVRDHRFVSSIPVQRFGYETPVLHGRFMKGSSLSNCFASGDRVGNVRLWDLRNVKKPRAQIECFNGQKIAHLVFQSSRLLACSENNQIRLVKYDRPI